MEEIKKLIHKCPWRDDSMVGKSRNEAYAICRGYCLPCLAVIQRGKCEAIKDMLEKKRGATNDANSD